jgi:hypothetical protein
MALMSSLRLFASSAGGLAFLLTTIGAQIPARLTLSSAHYVVEYSAPDNKIARDLADGLERQWPAPPSPSAAALALTFDVLTTEKDALLHEICRRLGRDQPSASMGEVYDFGLALGGSLSVAGAQFDSRHFTIWHSAQLEARVKAGEWLPWPLPPNVHADGAIISQRNLPHPGAAEAGFLLVIPDDEEFIDQPIVDRWLKKLAEFKTQQEQLPAMLHGSGAVHTTLQGAAAAASDPNLPARRFDELDRAWFDAGVGNYVAFEVIAARVGLTEARRYYDLDAELKQSADVKTQIDFAHWKNLQSQADGTRRSVPNQAYFAFATDMAFRIAARHGDDIWRKLFAKIDEHSAETSRIDAVYRAFKAVTGEELSSYFPTRG